MKNNLTIFAEYSFYRFSSNYNPLDYTINTHAVIIMYMRAWTKSINKIGLCIILRRITEKCIRENVCLIKNFFKLPG